MKLRLAALPLCALLLIAAAPAADDAKCPPRPGMMTGMLSPEQRMMMMEDARAATADGSLSMQDYRAMQRDKMRAMTPEQRQAYVADLTKRWNALPAAEQQKLKAEAAAFRKEHEGMRNCPPPPPNG
jgi:Spy/CpxP family protein refolding chaperone